MKLPTLCTIMTLVLLSCGGPEESEIRVDKAKASSQKEENVNLPEGFIYDKESIWTLKQQLFTFNALNNVSAEDVQGVNAQKQFTLYCSPCHGMNGRMTSMGAKDLTLSSRSREEVFTQMAFGQGAMTAFKGTLTEVQMAALTEYALSLRGR